MNSSATLSAPPAPAAELAAALRANREQTLTQLYAHTFPMLRRYVQQRGGSAQDAKDVFQDAVVVLYEQAVSGRLTLTASASTYLFSVSRNLWKQELSRRSRQPATPLSDDHTQLPDTAATDAAPPDVTDMVLQHLAQLTTKCRRMLVSFYYFQQPLEQIAAEHQYGSIRSATVQKFKCLERLRNAVRPVFRNAFTS
ncbi:RNA polymerase sigma factor [Hymenobacter metallilatus]|uniref:Sigma-70 family RNA polymerase sigma factor n=1 Tax=Hymenobacter metallilatus TaxID=2493666 RepID=A0A428JTT3_9BACT|nr:sigma-70 family RNA polymerase sigma factor [Hymenobacter metallilatus]RSK37456.1 sigma-70 family RNA polymerase sigma factor [Hymenobacter metallilatus]